MSDTPKTDAMVAKLEAELGDGPPCISPAAIDVAVRLRLTAFARELERELRPSGPSGGIEARIVDAAMRRLVEWREQNPEGLLPIEHHRAILGPGRALIEACLELEESRLGATTGGNK